MPEVTDTADEYAYGLELVLPPASVPPMQRIRALNSWYEEIRLEAEEASEAAQLANRRMTIAKNTLAGARNTRDQLMAEILAVGVVS